MTEALPKTVGRYEIQQEIGRGTMGVVYRASDPLLQRTIALKTIELAFAIEPGQRELFEKRFFAEARIAARLAHPNIVVVHDVGREEATGTLFIALEYLEGRTLAALLKQRARWEWREALLVIRKLASALDHAHSHKVVHRDVKPANIMILASGEPKIMDFGIAKIETARLRLTQGGEFFGTPLYMSPEQALGHEVDGRADLFALGAIGYELLTGIAAFAADSLPKVAARVIGEDPLPPSRVVPSLPPAIDEWIARALAKSPADRYPDGRTLAEDADEVLAGRALHSRAAPVTVAGTLCGATALPKPGGDEGGGAAGAAPSGRRARARSLGVRTLAAAGAVVLLVIAAAYLARRSDPDQAPSPPSQAEPSPSGVAQEPTAPGDEAREASPPSASGAPSPEPAATPQPRTTLSARQAPAASARLAIEFQHSLKQGRLRVWVDDELVLEQELDSLVSKKIVFVEKRKGSVEDLVEVSPGPRVVKVQVSWDEKVKTRRISGTFKAGITRRLQARLAGLLRKELSLDWDK